MVASNTSLRETSLGALWGLLLVGLSFFIHINNLPYAEDDAYIHMRVARHLWTTGFPYFNHHEPVMASTSTLWLLLSGPAAVAGELQPLAVACLNTLLLTSASWVWGLAFAALSQPHARLPHRGALVVTFLTLAPSSIGLMETPLALMLTGLGYLGVLKGRWWSVPVCSLAPFVRPECIVFTIAIILYRFYSRPGWSLRECIATILPVSLLSMFEIHFFGSIIPHTAQVKDLVYEISTSEFVRFFLFGSYGSSVAQRILPFSIALGVLAFVALIFSCKVEQGSNLFQRSIRKPAPLVFILAPAAIILLTYALKHVLIFPWYTPLVLVPAHLGFLSLVRLSRISAKMLGATLLTPLVFVGLLLVSSVRSPELALFFESGARARQLRTIGAALYRSFPGARLMAPEIGALGFSFKGRIIDAIGLASPQALKFHPMQVPQQRPAGFLGAVPAAFVASEKPEFLVGLSVFFSELLASPAVEEYDVFKRGPMSADDLARVASGSVFGADHILIFRRKDLRGPEGDSTLEPGR